ncbi:MAG: PfkB family carbohydrate kinase, partial [Propionibacteriaceae bacterium]|nr:PfkB family carbohydrate kinase [Propionibacteriaceae bacterium]
MTRSKAIAIGEALIDIAERAGQPRAEYPGGSPLNVAIGLGRLGHPTVLATWLGADDRGDTIVRHCRESGVELVPGSQAAPRTSTALARIDDSGHAEYVFDLLWKVVPLPEGIEPLVVHTGSNGAVIAPGADDVAAILAATSRSATITYDPNVRPDIMGVPDAIRPAIARLVALADVVKVSNEDLAWLYPGAEPKDTAAAWTKLGPAMVILTMGAAGSIALTRSGLELRQRPDPSVTVADTVGAGDSF